MEKCKCFKHPDKPACTSDQAFHDMKNQAICEDYCDSTTIEDPYINFSRFAYALEKLERKENDFLDQRKVAKGIVKNNPELVEMYEKSERKYEMLQCINWLK